MIVNAGYRGKVGGGVPKFTYTGQYNQRDDGVVELLTSGTLVFLNPSVIDIFCVGGGGAGGNGYPTKDRAMGGGGGGYTATIRKQRVSGSYAITIGAGGIVPSSYTQPSTDGGTTSFGNLLTAEGGKHGICKNTSGNTDGATKGGDGGSGGGSATLSSSNDGSGGSDGNNGGVGLNGMAGGAGQGSTTREFGESDGKLYSGGGGGGRYRYGQTPNVNPGGSGGGGDGAWLGTTTNFKTATPGAPNTGGGGGGAAMTKDSAAGKAMGGGSGICCFRAAK